MARGVAAVRLGVLGEPPVRHRPSPAARSASTFSAAIFSAALMWIFLIVSSTGEKRVEPMSQKSRANWAPPAWNLSFSHGRSMRSWGSRVVPSGSSPRATTSICSRNIFRSMATPMSLRPRCSVVRSVICPCVIQAMMSWPST